MGSSGIKWQRANQFCIPNLVLILLTMVPAARAQFILPDLLHACPLTGGTNPHYEVAAAQSAAWIKSYDVFSPKKREFFDRGYNELLVSHTYPYAEYEQFRTCCDFVNLLFVVDEISDDQNGRDARATCDIFLRAMSDESYNDSSKLCRMTHDFRRRYTTLAGSNTAARFLKHCKDYIDAVAHEAELREMGQVLDIAAFTDLRRENSAIRLCFGLFEYALGIDLPQYVFDDPAFMKVYMAAADLVCWANDVYSYNMEQRKGHTGNNIITVLMKAEGMTLQAAADHVGKYFNVLMARFMEGKSDLPSWGSDVDADVDLYCTALGHWVRGNLDWSFETQRYFGLEHRAIKRTRLVTLLPVEIE